MPSSMTHEARAERRQRMAEEVANGLRSIAGTGSFYKVSVETVRRACKEAHVNLELAMVNLSGRVAVAIQSGSDIKQVCETYGVDESFVREACQDRGISLDPLDDSSDNTLDVLSDLINTSDTLLSIAKKRRITHSAVSRLYLRAIARGIPVVKRKPGHQSGAPRKIRPIIAVTLDDAIDDHPKFFRLMTKALGLYADIHVIASERVGSREAVEAELRSKGIEFHSIALTDSISSYVRRHGVDVLIDNKDENIIGIGESVLVLKVRDAENFCFKNKHWLYSENTGEEV